MTHGSPLVNGNSAMRDLVLSEYQDSKGAAITILGEERCGVQVRPAAPTDLVPDEQDG